MSDASVPVCEVVSLSAPGSCDWGIKGQPKIYATHICELHEEHEGPHQCFCGVVFIGRNEEQPEPIEIPPTSFLRVTI